MVPITADVPSLYYTTAALVNAPNNAVAARLALICADGQTVLVTAPLPSVNELSPVLYTSTVPAVGQYPSSSVLTNLSVW